MIEFAISRSLGSLAVDSLDTAWFELPILSPISVSTPPRPDKKNRKINPLIFAAREELAKKVRAETQETPGSPVSEIFRLPTVTLPPLPGLLDFSDLEISSFRATTLEGEMELLRRIGNFKVTFERFAKAAIFRECFGLQFPGPENQPSLRIFSDGRRIPPDSFGFEFEFFGARAAVILPGCRTAVSFPLLAAAVAAAPVLSTAGPSGEATRALRGKRDFEQISRLVETDLAGLPGVESELGVRLKLEAGKLSIAAINPRWTPSSLIDLGQLLKPWDLPSTNLRLLNLRVAIKRALGEDCSEELGAVTVALVEKFKTTQRTDLLMKAIATGLISREVCLGRPTLSSQLGLIEARFWLDKVYGEPGFSGAQATFYAVRRELQDPLRLLAVDSLMASLMASEGGAQGCFDAARRLLRFEPRAEWTAERGLREISLAVLRLIQTQS